MHRFITIFAEGNLTESTKGAIAFAFPRFSTYGALMI